MLLPRTDSRVRWSCKTRKRLYAMPRTRPAMQRPKAAHMETKKNLDREFMQEIVYSDWLLAVSREGGECRPQNPKARCCSQPQERILGRLGCEPKHDTRRARLDKDKSTPRRRFPGAPQSL